MKYLSILTMALSLTVLAGSARALDLTPVMPLEYRNNVGKIIEVVCKFDDDEVWSIALPDGGGKYAAEGPESLLITPAVPQSSIRITLVKLDGLPADFETKEALAFYDAVVKKNIPQGATEIGSLKRAGGFSSDKVNLSDSFGLVYNFNTQKYAVACGFVNHKEQGIQLRYTLSAPVKSFEALHRHIRYELSDFRRRSPEDVQKLNGTTLPE